MEYTTSFGLQSQTTRLLSSVLYHWLLCHEPWTGLSPSPVPHFRGLWFKQSVRTCPQITTLRRDYKFELIPVHSPLLRESLLVSFPPLINMLKFSGYSYLIWDLPYMGWFKKYGPNYQSASNKISDFDGHQVVVWDGPYTTPPQTTPTTTEVEGINLRCQCEITLQHPIPWLHYCQVTSNEVVPTMLWHIRGTILNLDRSTVMPL